MGKSSGVTRTTYRGKDGQIREASTWHLTYYDRAAGKHIREYGFPSAAAARERRAEILRASRTASSATITVEQVCDLVIADYESQGRRSLRGARAKRELVLASFGQHYLARNIDARSIQRHIARMREQGYAPATINRSLALLRRGMRLAQRAIPSLIVPHFAMLDERPAIRQGFLAPDDLARLLAALPPIPAAAVRLLHATGWRVGEILSRRWTDIEEGWLLLRPGETKNGRPRAYPIEQLRPILEGLPRSGPLILGGLTISGLRVAWDRARASTGLSRVLLHDLRRTAARDLIKAGVDRTTAKRVTGHITDSIFERYQIVTGSDLTAAAQALSDYRKG